MGIVPLEVGGGLRPAQISHERNGFFGGLSTGAKTAARYAALTEAETSGAAVFTHNAQA